MKTQWVNQLRPGLTVSSPFGVLELALARARNGGRYLKLTLGDRTGRVEARVWDPVLAEELDGAITVSRRRSKLSVESGTETS